jgi:hypothetical protein
LNDLVLSANNRCGGGNRQEKRESEGSEAHIVYLEKGLLKLQREEM